MAADPAGTHVDDYRFWLDEHVRFSDLDMLGHVNNIAYAVYCETIRAAFFHKIGLFDIGGDRNNVIVRFEMDYRHEIRYPAALKIGLVVSVIGTSSFGMQIGIFQGDVCAATATNVVVRWERATRKTVPLEADARAKLMAWFRPPADA